MNATEQALDAVAEAYADDPETVGDLLVALAAALSHREHAAHSPCATDYGRDVAGAHLDACRADLADALDLPAEHPAQNGTNA